MRVRAVVGDSGSGKTLLVEHLVAALHDKGQRVAYIKHAPHGFAPGKAGSDTDRVAQAGAQQCFVVDGSGHVRREHPTGHDAPEAMLLGGVEADVVLLEGFTSSAWPKIRVTCRGTSPRQVAEPVLHDVVRDEEGFSSAEVRAARDSILASGTRLGDPVVAVWADGQDVPVRGFAARTVASTVRGLCSALHGVHEPEELSVTVRWPGTEGSEDPRPFEG